MCVMSHFDVAPVDHVDPPVQCSLLLKGKLVERQGRKATGLRDFRSYDSGVAILGLRAAFICVRGSLVAAAISSP
jgi:hypothetical protein